MGKHNAKARFETLKDSNYLITSLCIEYIGEFLTLNQKDPMILFWIPFINLLPNWWSSTSLHIIEFHFLHWEVQLSRFFFSCIVNPIISFHFGWVYKQWPIHVRVQSGNVRVEPIDYYYTRAGFGVSFIQISNISARNSKVIEVKVT